VLYLTEPIDEVAIQNLAEYDDKKFVDVSREGIDLGADDQDTKKVIPLSSLCVLSVLM
jgi:heat shock protein beta